MTSKLQTPPDRFRIDVHHHYHLTRFQGLTPAYTPSRAGLLPEGTWRPESHFEFMDRWGIEAALLSDPALPRLELDVGERRKLSQQINDFNAKLIRDHGARFGTFAAVPLPDVEGAVLEARRALTELSLDGIFVGTHYFNRHLGDAMFEPFYEELNRHHAVVYVHPASLDCAPEVIYQQGLTFALPPMEFVFETTRTIASIVYSGVGRRYPNIRWIFSHGGGTIPFLSFRFAGYHTQEPRYNEVLPEGPGFFLKQFFYDTAQAFSSVQLEMVKSIAPTGHILFGTDYPPMQSLYGPHNADETPSIAAELPANGEPAPAFDLVFGGDRIKVERLNALSLFPKLAARLGKSAAAGAERA